MICLDSVQRDAFRGFSLCIVVFSPCLYVVMGILDGFCIILVLLFSARGSAIAQKNHFFLTCIADMNVHKRN